jgi:hypothetical protein
LHEFLRFYRVLATRGLCTRAEAELIELGSLAPARFPACMREPPTQDFMRWVLTIAQL